MDMGIPQTTLIPLPVHNRSRYGALSPIVVRPFVLMDCFLLEDDSVTKYADFAVSPLSSAPQFFD